MSTTEINNPYLNARREWNERYGSYISQAATWRVIALFAMLLAIISVSGALYLAQQSKFIPYIVEVDQLGRAHAVGPATEGSKIDPRVTKALLARFVENWRNITMDVMVQKNRAFDLYAHLSTASAAYMTLNEYYQKSDPFKRAQSELVNVEVTSLLRIGEDIWQAEWTETTRSRKGKILRIQFYQSAMKLSYTHQADNADQLSTNPVGLFVDELSWSEILNTQGDHQ
ncbi:MAG: conjugal transfer protein [Sedimenticola sp.]|uniref:Conjugal transfer protein n=2 Tax=Sedimenticola TaxID=349742 RepID=A0A558CLT9_9GAMM|nr:VirB8/TrbF family protein [Sedimenticola selenatireducens]PLY12873.1 MAG: conjugal transfer protein [Sedimenticola sp.]TVO69684.1 conjugal transfer protein [Sedimenticola selenatireducens]TVT49685.1 MAG: conjugal transfer protein [Sedimenticola thiotaurini]TVT62248.1 MAG: conjugal transfer protein [Sedimenticola selenatireducens]